MTKTYLVRWEIEVDAESPYSAAVQAFEIQQDIDTTATLFEVCDLDLIEKRTINVRTPPERQPPGCV
jgi:hypothetical protein